MKKLRPVLGISLIVQSLTFFVLCLVNVEKKKNLAKAFGVFSAIGGAAGAALLVAEYKERKVAKEEFDAEDYFDEIFDEFDELADEEECIDCTFAENEAEAEAEA